MSFTTFHQVLKAMLHQAIFLATCNATNLALQVARKEFTCNTQFCNCKLLLHCELQEKNDPLLFAALRDMLLACNIPSATYNAILSEWANQSSPFARCLQLSASAVLFVIGRVASCEKSCKRVTPPLQLVRFFIRHCCVASCKKNCFV